MEFLKDLPNETNAFNNYKPTRGKKMMSLDVEDMNNEINNDETHVLLKHLDSPSKPRVRTMNEEEHDKKESIKEVKERMYHGVVSKQMDLDD